jgi:3-hydroxybutyryl-CoA dehydrogenase
MEIRKVGVVGCGLMGSGIAQVAAQSGYDVTVREVSDELLKKGLGKIEAFLRGGVEKGKVTEADAKAALSRLKGTTKLEDLAGSDLVVEAVVENIATKREVFQTLDRICGEHAILASNTSSISITEIGGSTKRPDRVIGLHFFNPVPIMKLVEVVRGLVSSEASVQAGIAFGKSLGKHPIVAKDHPGFIVNLLLVPYLLGAVRAFEKGLASREDIDEGMKLGCGYPMGPLTLLDFVGIDTTYYIANIMFEEFKDPMYAPPTLLKQMVMAGHFGRKSGKGFYDYTQGK